MGLIPQMRFNKSKPCPLVKTLTLVLIIGIMQDPAIPYASAKGLANYITGSRSITLEGEGHTGYGRGSACVDDAVGAYLLTGTVPIKNLICA